MWLDLLPHRQNRFALFCLLELLTRAMSLGAVEHSDRLRERELASPASSSRHLQQHYTVFGHFNCVLVLYRTNVLVLPKIAHFRCAAETNRFEIQSHLQSRFAPIEQTDGLALIGQRLYPYFQRTLFPNPMALHTLSVLVNSKDLSVGQHFFGLGSHASQVVTGKQRRGQ